MLSARADSNRCQPCPLFGVWPRIPVMLAAARCSISRYDALASGSLWTACVTVVVGLAGPSSQAVSGAGPCAPTLRPSVLALQLILVFLEAGGWKRTGAGIAVASPTRLQPICHSRGCGLPFCVAVGLCVAAADRLAWLCSRSHVAVARSAWLRPVWRD